MSNLNQHIRQWRKNLSEGGLDRAEINELEAHLRDRMDEFRADAVSEAFARVVAELGEPAQLADEFAKRDRFGIRSSVRRCGRWKLYALWTLMALAVYRMAFFIPMPGIDQARLAEWVEGGRPLTTIDLYLRTGMPSQYLGLVVLLLAYLAGIVLIYWRKGKIRG